MNLRNNILLKSLIALALFSKISFAEQVNFSGNLVAEPCDIQPGNTPVEVRFGAINVKELYSNGQTAPQPVNLTLLNCDLSIATSVSATFTGNDNGNGLQGYLSFSTGSSASGAAIGIMTPSGNLLPLGTTSPQYTLSTGTTQLNFTAIVKAEPQAQADNTIKAGNFDATSTLVFNYQ